MARQPKRIIRHRSFKVCGAYDSIVPEELIKLRDEKISVLPEQFHKTINFEIDSYHYEYDPDTYHGLYMKWEEFETDQELRERLEQDELARLAKEKLELKEFERLSKKFSK